MGAPGWPDLAFCTASMASVRMVSIESVSMLVSAGMAPGLAIWSAADILFPLLPSGYGAAPRERKEPCPRTRIVLPNTCKGIARAAGVFANQAATRRDERAARQ